MARRSIVIDTDTASDDAVALVLAVREPSVDVRAVTVVAGNVPLDLAVRNAIVTLDLAGGAAIPLHAGRDRPLVRPLDTAQFVHGLDGMGGADLPEPSRPATSDDAVGALLDIAANEPGRHDLVTLGPLTNIALAFRRDPALAARIGSMVVMGGTSDAVGNVSAAAEFNIFADPEAAAVVFASDASITMVGWDISRLYAVIDHDDAATIRGLGPLAALAMDIQAKVDVFATHETHLAGFDLPDPIAMAVALDPRVATRVEHRNVVVETRGEFTAGQTVVDHLGLTGRPPNVHVVREASRAAFIALLHERLRG